MKLLFFGSPAVAVPFLETCVRSGHEVAAVVTQPDRPAGRGMTLKSPPVKAAAQRLGLEVLAPDKMSDIREALTNFKADAAIVVAFGRFFKPKMLASTRLGFLNVHFSLLPKYRGAAPVQWSLINGEAESGVTLFWIVEAMDAGPVQRRASLEVGPDEDAPGLFERLIDLGVRELKEALSDLATGKVLRTPQEGEPTMAPKLTAENAQLDFELSALEFHNRVRGLRGGPKAYLKLEAEGRKTELRVNLLKTKVENTVSAGEPGRLLSVDEDKGILVQCSVGRCWIIEVQPEGKKPQKAVDFLNGVRWKEGDRLVAVA